MVIMNVELHMLEQLFIYGCMKNGHNPKARINGTAYLVNLMSHNDTVTGDQNDQLHPFLHVPVTRGDA